MKNTVNEIEKFLREQEIKMDTQDFIYTVSNYFHDEESKSYDYEHNEIFNAELHRYLKDALLSVRKYNSTKKMKVLDVGAGTGFLSRLIYEQVEISELHCLEPSVEMLEVLKDKMKGSENVNYHNCSIEELQIFDFDLIVNNSVLHHIPDVQTFLISINKRLKSGGHYLISHEPYFNFYTNARMVKFNQRIRLIERIVNRVRKSLLKLRSNKSSVIPISIEGSVNAKLTKDGLIIKPLHGHAIRKLIDIHIPIAGSEFKWGLNGFNSQRIIEMLYGYKEIYFKSYEPVRSRYAILRGLGSLFLNKKSKQLGHNFMTVVQKP